MSRSPYFFVERFNRYTGKYELQHPIIWNEEHTKQVLADLFPYNGCHDLFSIVENKNIGDIPDMKGIHAGLPKDVCQDIYDSYHEYDEEDNKFSYMPTAHWFTYADMYIYCLEHPKVIDYEAMDEACYNTVDNNEEIEKIYTDTPMKTLKNRVDAFMEVMDGWDWEDDYSQIRIVCWIF